MYQTVSPTEFNEIYQAFLRLIGSKENIRTISNLLAKLPHQHILKRDVVLNRDIVNEANGRSLIHQAASDGKITLIRLLKLMGHDINLLDDNDKTALFYACDKLKLKSVDVLLELGADPNRTGLTTPINSEESMEVNEDGNSDESMRTNDSRSSEAGYDEKTPLVAVIESQSTVTTVEGSFPGLTQEEITEQIRVEIVKKLLKADANVSYQCGTERFSAIDYAVLNLKPLVVEALIDSERVNFKQRDSEGKTVLHKITEYLTEEEQQITQRMQLAKKILYLILPHCDSIDTQDNEGDTAFHVSVRNNNAAVVKELNKKDYLYPGLNLLSIRNNLGNTVIHEAIKEVAKGRGKYVLSILLRVATQDDLAILNNNNETPLQLAEKLSEDLSKTILTEALVDDLALAHNIGSALEKVNNAIADLENLLRFPAQEQVNLVNAMNSLKQAIQQLEEEWQANHPVNGLEHALEKSALNNEENIQQEVFTVEAARDLIDKTAHSLVSNIKNEIKQEIQDRVDCLNAVKQEDFFAWKVEKLELPSSFPNLYAGNLAQAERQAKHQEGVNDLALANLYLNGLQNSPENDLPFILEARVKIEQSIQCFFATQDMYQLENAYQALARSYIKEGPDAIKNFYEENNAKTSLTRRQDRWEGHLALAALFTELKLTNQYKLFSWSLKELEMEQVFNFHDAYRLSQGELDEQARPVLQRELGIANDGKLGTTNIQQCVAVFAFEPVSQRRLLIHFDRYTGPLSFIQQILQYFPDPDNQIHLYIVGARDLGTTLSRHSATLTSDSNVNQVLKQIYAYQDRFIIKTMDVMGKPCPPAVVFDMESQRVVHAVPDAFDMSLTSREVYFYMQSSKADYLSPLNVVDFSKPEAKRTIHFSVQEQSKILQAKTGFGVIPTQTNAWNAQSYYPLLIEANGIEERRRYISDRFVGRTISFSPESARDLPSDIKNLPCMSRRRRELAAQCVLDSKALLDALLEMDKNNQQDEVNEFLSYLDTQKPKMAGNKQQEIATLTRNHAQSRFYHKLGRVASILNEGKFTADAVLGFFNDNKEASAQWVDFKLADLGLERAAEKIDAQGLSLINSNGQFLGKLVRSGGMLVRSGTTIFNMALVGFDLDENIQALQKNISNTDAWVRTVSDGIQLTSDGAILGVKVLEVGSETIAAMELSSFIEPAGAAVVMVVMLVDDFYVGVTTVKREQALLHKDFSFGTKLTEFGRAFFGLLSQFQKDEDEILGLERFLVKQNEFLQTHPQFKYLITSDIYEISDGRKCIDRPYKGKNCRAYSFNPTYGLIANNSVDFSAKQTGFKLNGAALTAFQGSESICLPTGDDVALTAARAYRCDYALGLHNPNSTGTTAFINLGEGNDHALGFINSPNIFLVNNGAKGFVGGGEEDEFIVVGTQVTANQQNSRMGGLHGGEGRDTLDLRGFKPPVSHVELNLQDEYMKCDNNKLPVTGMERVIGGAIPLGVTVACATQELDTAILGVAKSPDTIFVPNIQDCNHTLTIHLRPNITVTNEAEKGDFVYSVSPSQGSALVELSKTSVSSRHQFIINASLSDVSAIVFPEQLNEGSLRTLRVQFGKSNQSAENFIFGISAPQFNNTSLHFLDQGVLKVGGKTLHYFHSDLSKSATEIIEYFAPLMRQLNLIGSFIIGDNEHILLGHNGHEVMQNNPNAYQTHLHGNGGETVFLIRSEGATLASSHLPIPDVNIYHFSTGIDTLDLRLLAQQVQTEFNQTAKLFLVTPNAQNGLGDSLSLILGIPSIRHPQQMTPIVTVNMPKAFHPSQHHWFKKNLHIILDVAPLRIVGRHKHLFLQPVPLVINPQQEVTVLSTRNVLANTEVVIPRRYHSGAFYQDNQTNLIWMSTEEGKFALMVKSFYIVPILKTLILQFNDERVLLDNEITWLNKTKDFQIETNASLDKLSKEFTAILNADAIVNVTLSANDTRFEGYVDSLEAEQSNEIPLLRGRRSIPSAADNKVDTATGLRLYQTKESEALAVSIQLSSFTCGVISGVCREISERYKQHYPRLPTIMFYGVKPMILALGSAAMNSVLLGSAESTESIDLEAAWLSFAYYLRMNYVGLMLAQLGEKATQSVQNKLMKLVLPVLLYTFFLNPSLLIALLSEGLSMPEVQTVTMPILSMFTSGLFFKTGEWCAKQTIGKCLPVNQIKDESKDRCFHAKNP